MAWWDSLIHRLASHHRVQEWEKNVENENAVLTRGEFSRTASRGSV